MRSDTGRSIHTIRAKSQGERWAHAVARRAFLTHVRSDARTRALFQRWGTVLDATIADYILALDIAALQAGLSHRSELHNNREAIDWVTPETIDIVTGAKRRCDDLQQQTRAAREGEVIAFICEELLIRRPHHADAVCVWLGADLLDLFDARVVTLISGQLGPEPVAIPLSPTPGPVPKGQRPKHEGEHIARDIEWVYLADVAEPRTPVQRLVAAYVASRKKAGVSLEPRWENDNRIQVRVDTKPVRWGIAEGWRLLTLPIPISPQQRSSKI